MAAGTSPWPVPPRPSGNEAIVIGVTDDRHVSGSIWNGSAWTPIAINVGGTTKQNLGNPSAKEFWGAAVAYETNSGRAMLVWNTGTTLNYSIWNGTSWTAAATIPAYTGVEPRQIRIASNPLAGSNEIVITVTDKNEVDRALVWNGTTWGNQIQLDNTRRPQLHRRERRLRAAVRPGDGGVRLRDGRGGRLPDLERLDLERREHRSPRPPAPTTTRSGRSWPGTRTATGSSWAWRATARTRG